MHRWVYLALAASCWAATAAAGRDVAFEYQGTAFVRTDAEDRVIVVLDVTGDGRADDLFIFEPIERIAGGIAPRVAEVEVTFRESDLSVVSRDGRLSLELHATSPPEGAAATERNGESLRAHGTALLHTWLEPGADAIEAMDTDAIRVFASCGETDTDCKAGGADSGSCGVNCPSGSGSVMGIGGGYNPGGCQVSCNLAVAYSCCQCEASGGNCKCRSTAALKPCGKPAPRSRPKNYGR